MFPSCVLPQSPLISFLGCSALMRGSCGGPGLRAAHIPHTPDCGSEHIPAPLACLHTAYPVLTPGLSALRLETAGWWPGPCVHISLSCTPQSMLFPQLVKGESTFPVAQLPPRGAGPILIPWFFFFFCHTSYMISFLAVLIVWGLLPASSGYSVRIVPHRDVV